MHKTSKRSSDHRVTAVRKRAEGDLYLRMLYFFLSISYLATILLKIYKSLLALPTVLVPIIYASTPTHVPLATSTVALLGQVSDPVSNQGGIFHDGGGGASQNGYHVMVFADSDTTSEGFNFVHNSVAYFGFRDPSNPLNLYSFGMSGSQGSAKFTGIVPVGPEGNETALGSDFAIWMYSGMTPMPDGQTILGVFQTLNEGTSTYLYSTMVQMNVTSPYDAPAGGNPPFSRLGTGRLFYPNEVNYGTFALQVEIDGYLYLYGSDVTGVKLARTPNTPSSIADRKQYSYYNSAKNAWQSTPLKLNSATGNIITWSSTDLAGEPIGPNLGDVWFDNYHLTTVMMWGDQGIDGTFWFSYATTNNLEGPWSTPVAIYTPSALSKCSGTTDAWNYQGHAHPGWDTTGKTLLISFASCAEYVSMARITWA